MTRTPGPFGGAGQLVLDLAPPPRDLGATFVAGPASARARAALADPSAWPGGALALVGPAFAGKTHLARLWARERGATWRADAAGGDRPPSGALCVDGVDSPTGPIAGEAGQAWVFAVFERLRAGAAGPVLFTARTPPAAWPARLPDLRSRFAALATVSIEDPDDAELGAVFAKHLADRGADAGPDLVSYMVRRLPRTHAAAAEAARALDAFALERQKRVSRRLAQELFHDDVDAALDDPPSPQGSLHGRERDERRDAPADERP